MSNQDQRPHTPDEIADLMAGMTLPAAVQALRRQIERTFVSPSREKSLALTKLDECELWLSAVQP